MKKNKIILIFLICILILTISILGVIRFIKSNKNLKSNVNNEDESYLEKIDTYETYFSGYCFYYKEPISIIKDAEKDELLITNKNNLAFKLFVRDNSYTQRLKEKNSLTKSVTDAGYTITKDIHEETIKDVNILYFEYKNDEESFIAGYIEKSEKDVWGFLGSLKNTSSKEILDNVSMLIKNVKVIPTTQKVNNENVNISFSIPDGFVRYKSENKEENDTAIYIDNKFYNFKYVYDDNISNKYTNVTVSLEDPESLTYYYKKDDGNLYANYRTFDELLELEISNLKNSLEIGSYNNLNIYPTESLMINGKELNYFKVSYSYDEYNGIKNVEKIIALYPLNKENYILKYQFETFKSDVSLDLSTLKMFFDIEEN